MCDVIDTNRCMWRLTEEHGGAVTKRKLFEQGNSIMVDICERHMVHHKSIMFLYANAPNLNHSKKCEDQLHKEVYDLSSRNIGFNYHYW